MPADGTVVFDIIGTCFSLDSPRRRLAELGAPEHALELWFAQTLRDAIALSHAGRYRPLRDVLRAELPRTRSARHVRDAPHGASSCGDGAGYPAASRPRPCAGARRAGP